MKKYREEISTHLRLDQDQINKQNHKVMLDIFITESPAILAHSQPDIVARRLIAASFAPECLDWVAALDAYRHRIQCE